MCLHIFTIRTRSPIAKRYEASGLNMRSNMRPVSYIYEGHEAEIKHRNTSVNARSRAGLSYRSEPMSMHKTCIIRMFYAWSSYL
jgi:hypothetical protein